MGVVWIVVLKIIHDQRAEERGQGERLREKQAGCSSRKAISI